MGSAGVAKNQHKRVILPAKFNLRKGLGEVSRGYGLQTHVFVSIFGSEHLLSAVFDAQASSALSVCPCATVCGALLVNSEGDTRVLSYNNHA